MKSLFSLHPAAVAGELLAGQPNPGPARHDAEPELGIVPADGRRRRLAARLAVRRRRGATAAAARSANV